MPALALLGYSLTQWFQKHNSLVYTFFAAQEVRESMASRPNASCDQLAYAVMACLGLIGQDKTTHEREALAVGHYHLTQRAEAVNLPS